MAPATTAWAVARMARVSCSRGRMPAFRGWAANKPQACWATSSARGSKEGGAPGTRGKKRESNSRTATRTKRKATPITQPRGSGTTASSRRRKRAGCWRWRFRLRSMRRSRKPSGASSGYEAAARSPSVCNRRLLPQLKTGDGAGDSEQRHPLDDAGVARDEDRRQQAAKTVGKKNPDLPRRADPDGRVQRRSCQRAGHRHHDRHQGAGEHDRVDTGSVDVPSNDALDAHGGGGQKNQRVEASTLQRAIHHIPGHGKAG